MRSGAKVLKMILPQAIRFNDLCRMNDAIKGKVITITGASSGIGEAIDVGEIVLRPSVQDYTGRLFFCQELFYIPVNGCRGLVYYATYSQDK